MVKGTTDRPVIAWVEISRIRFGEEYQRKVRPAHVRRIANNFDWRFFQTPTLVSIPNTIPCEYDCPDGQHRIKGAQLAGIDEVPAYITEAATLEERARLFVALNTQVQRITPVDIYHAAVASRDPEYVRLKKVLDSTGVSVVPYVGYKSVSMTSSVTALRRALTHCGEDALENALIVLSRAQPQNDNAFPGNFITALSRFFRESPGADIGVVTSALAKQDYRELGLMAQRDAELGGGSTPTALMKTVAKLYRGSF